MDDLERLPWSFHGLEIQVSLSDEVTHKVIDIAPHSRGNNRFLES